MLDLDFYRTVEIQGLICTRNKLLKTLRKKRRRSRGDEKIFAEKNPIKCETYTFKGSSFLEEDTTEKIYYDSRSPWGKALYESIKEETEDDENYRREKWSVDNMAAAGFDIADSGYLKASTNNKNIENMKRAIAYSMRDLSAPECIRLFKSISGKKTIDIAKEENVSFQAVSQSIIEAKKKIKKKYELFMNMP